MDSNVFVEQGITNITRWKFQNSGKFQINVINGVKRVSSNGVIRVEVRVIKCYLKLYSAKYTEKHLEIIGN